MKEYEYQGEKFQVDESGGCEIKVSDGNNTAVVKYNSIYPANNTNGRYPYVYRAEIVGSPQWASEFESPHDALVRSCGLIVQYRNRPTFISQEEACKALKEQIDNL